MSENNIAEQFLNRKNYQHGFSDIYIEESSKGRECWLMITKKQRDFYNAFRREEDIEKDKNFGKLEGILKVWRDPYDLGYNTTTPREVKFKKGLTVLTGCNGTGKTTMLQNIEQACKEVNAACFTFDNLTDGGSGNAGLSMISGDFEKAVALMCASEGESITINIGTFAKELGYIMSHEFKNAEEVWILLDATDSGYSIDNVVELKEKFFPLILEDKRDIYLIVAANSYEMARNERCMDVMSGKEIFFPNYEAYRNYVLKSKKRKEDREERARIKREKKTAKEQDAD